MNLIFFGLFIVIVKKFALDSASRNDKRHLPNQVEFDVQAHVRIKWYTEFLIRLPKDDPKRFKLQYRCEALGYLPM